MSSDQVYKAMRVHISNHDHKFENVFVHSWEADLFSVTKGAGYAYEFEVKISRSDFFADFKKPKHHFFKSFERGWGIIKGDYTWSSYSWREIREKPELKDVKIEERTNITALKIGQNTCPNKFFYCCPVGLIEECEVPKYAGLIYIMDSSHIRVVKKAPYLHKESIDERKMLFQKYYNLAITNEQKIGDLRRQVDRLKEKLNKLESV